MFQEGLILQSHYQLKEKLGESIDRQTWRAEDISDSYHKSVVIKFLLFASQINWDNFRLFEREIATLYHLNHPCIPQYQDYFSVEKNVWGLALVNNYIPGNSLRELIDSGRKFSEAEVQSIASSILDVLIYLHELSPTVIHRDIKPSNIILGTDGKIYLVDFGSIQTCAAFEGKTFTIVGTYGYTPIEQFGGRAVPASDLYALGATLIHLLTGTTPADLPQHNMRIQFRQYISLSSHLINWVESLTHPDVNQRFPTARQALTALETPKYIQNQNLTYQQPTNSRIQLTKNSLQLNIKIPQRGIRANDSLILFWIIILYSATIPLGIIVFPFIIFYWLGGLIPITFLILSTFSNVELIFDKEYFTFKWKLLWLRYRISKDYHSIIHTVHEKPDNKTLPMILEIQAGEKRYQFGGSMAPMSTLECQWLIYEIKDWLGLT